MAVLKGDFVYRDNPTYVVTSSSGSTLYTDKGKFIDLQAASGSNILGYRDDLLPMALEYQGYTNAKPQIFETQTRLNLAARLTDEFMKSTGRLGKIGFELSGANAIELAIKVATSRCRKLEPIIFTIDSCYHGRSMYVSHFSEQHRYRCHRLQFQQVHLPNPNALSNECDISQQQAIEQSLQIVHNHFQSAGLLTETTHYLPIFIYETIQNVGGAIEIDACYTQKIEDLIHQAGGITIADEIFTAMYRVSGFVDQTRMNLHPDITVISKGLTNGILPLSVIWVSDESGLSESFLPGTHSSTYLNSDFTFSLANVVLDKLSEFSLGDSELSAFCQEIKRRFSGKFETSLFRNYCSLSLPNSADIVKVRQKLATSDPGVIVAFTSQSKNKLLMHPAFTIATQDIQVACDVIESVIL